MTVESATYIDGLNATYPASGDAKSEGDDHLRLLKSVLKTTFPAVAGAVTPTHTELNYVDGVTSAIQTQLDAKLAVAGGNLSGDIDLNNNDIAGIKTANFEAEVDNGNSGASKTIDWNSGLRQKLTLSADTTLTFTAPPGVSNLILHIVGAATTYTVTWPSAVKWPNAAAPAFNTASKHHIIMLYYDGTNYFGAYSQNYTV